jgi:myosin heavy subunit
VIARRAFVMKRRLHFLWWWILAVDWNMINKVSHRVEFEDLSADSLDKYCTSYEEKFGLEELSSSPLPKRKLPAPRQWQDKSFPGVISVMKNTINGNTTDDGAHDHSLKISARLNTQEIVERLQKEHEEHETQKQHESTLKNSIAEHQQKIIDSFLQKEEIHKYELLKLKELHEQQTNEIKSNFHLQLKQKNHEIQQLQTQMSAMRENFSQKVKTINQQHYETLGSQEKKLEELYQKEKLKYEETIRNLKQSLSLQQENHKMTEKVEIEMKEEIAERKFTKKLLKYEKQVKNILNSYTQKELIMKGSIDEVRNELLRNKSISEIKEKQFHEELTLKDKRILLLEREINEVDNYIYTAKTWKNLASELAHLLIQSCATVEELPDELWTSTSPGIFSSIYDEFHGVKERPKSEQNYRRRKQDYVIVQRLLLSKCLKFGKVSFDPDIVVSSNV